MLTHTLITLFTAFSTLLAPKAPAHTDGLMPNGTHLNRTTLAAQVLSPIDRSALANGGRLVLR